MLRVLKRSAEKRNRRRMRDGAAELVVVPDLVPAVRRLSRPEEKYIESFHGDSGVVVARRMGL
jgi:hypothetical protein